MIKNKFILITGSNGFLGKKLVSRLKNDNIIYQIDINNNNSDSTKLNFNNQSKLKKFFLNKKIDYIFHFGGISDIDFSVKNPINTMKTNTIGLINILNLAVKKKIKKFIFASTIYTYSQQGSFYKISKLAGEEILEEYFRLYQLPYSVIRFGSIYGFDMNFKNSIMKMIYQAKQDSLILREGNGKEKRKFIDIDEAINLTISVTKKSNNDYNFFDIVGKKTYSVNSVISKIIKYFPSSGVKFTKINNFHHYINSPYNKKKFQIKQLSPSKDRLDKNLTAIISLFKKRF